MLFLAFLYSLLFPQLGSTFSLPVHYLDELGEQCHTPYVPSIQIQSVHNQFPPLEGIINCSLRVCLVGMKTGRMENRERKIRLKMTFFTLWLRGRGGREKWWGPQVFSSPPSKYNISKLERKLD